MAARGAQQHQVRHSRMLERGINRLFLWQWQQILRADTHGCCSKGDTGVIKEHFKPPGPEGKLRLPKFSEPFKEGRLIGARMAQ